MTGLVARSPGKPVKSAELASFTGVPAHYLSKIMRKLVEAGFVKSQKGHGGGFLLGVAPADIRIIDVLRATGFNMDDQPCVFGMANCNNVNPCMLHPAWKELKDCFNSWASRTTFKQISDDLTESSIDYTLKQLKLISARVPK